MDTTIVTNILFSALSILTMLVIIVFLMTMVYAIKIAKRCQEILVLIREETEKITHDVDAVRKRIKTGGSQFALFLSYLWSFFNKGHKKSRKNNK